MDFFLIWNYFALFYFSLVFYLGIKNKGIIVHYEEIRCVAGRRLLCGF